MGGIRRALIDAAFGEPGQFLVGRLLFVERLLQELCGFGVAHRLRPRDERAVGGHLVVLRSLAGSNQAGVHRGLIEVFCHDRVAFFDDAGDAVAVFAAGLLVESLEHLFEALNLPAGLLEVRFEGLA